MNLFENIHKDGTNISSNIVQKGECRLELQRGRSHMPNLGGLGLEINM